MVLDIVQFHSLGPSAEPWPWHPTCTVGIRSDVKPELVHAPAKPFCLLSVCKCISVRVQSKSFIGCALQNACDASLELSCTQTGESLSLTSVAITLKCARRWAKQFPLWSFQAGSRLCCSRDLLLPSRMCCASFDVQEKAGFEMRSESLCRAACDHRGPRIPVHSRPLATREHPS